MARSRPRPTQLVAPGVGLLDPGGDRGRIARVDEHRRAARDLLGRAPGARHHRRAAGHRLEHRDAEALVQRRVDEAARAAVERRELVVGDPAEPAVDLDAAPARRADDAQLDAEPLRGLLARRPGSSAARASRPRARSRPRPPGRRGRTARRPPFGITRIRSSGTPSSSTTSPRVNSDTAITRLAARATLGTAKRL